MIRCAENAPMEFTAESSSSSKTYRVRAFIPGESPTCDCMAFVMSRNRAGGKNSGATGKCKHVNQIVNTVCPWMEGTALAAHQTIPGVCPLCGGPTIDTSGAPAIPELPSKAVDAVTEKLLRMAQELEDRVEATEHESFDPAAIAQELCDAHVTSG